MERLALDRFASPWLKNQHLARYRWAAGFASGRRVLDAASGTGYGSALLWNAGARSVVSLDLTPEAFEDARASRRVAGDASRLPFASGSFDLYVSFETIEHVQDDHGLVEEAHRVLAPGGIFVCSTPNRDLLSPGLTIEDRPRNPYHVREYSIREFRALLQASFPRVSLLGQTWFSKAHRRRLAALGARSNHLAVRLHQLKNLSGLPWERPERHLPITFDEDGVPEVVLGVAYLPGNDSRTPLPLH